MSSTAHDVVNALMIARAHAEVLPESRPDLAEAAGKLVQEIDRIRAEFSQLYLSQTQKRHTASESG